MLEAREIIKPSVSKGEESSGFTNEFLLLAPGLKSLPDKGYRLYLESLFDEIGREVGVLFVRTDLAGQLWPDRPRLLELLELLDNPGLESVWVADETIGWVYQYFNSDDERRQMRADSAAPRNSREMAVRNSSSRHAMLWSFSPTIHWAGYGTKCAEGKLCSKSVAVTWSGGRTSTFCNLARRRFRLRFAASLRRRSFFVRECPSRTGHPRTRARFESLIPLVVAATFCFIASIS
jgi:hypothetical protein